MAQGMCVYLMIRRKKVTIFTDAKETTNVSELKKIIHGTVAGKLLCGSMFAISHFKLFITLSSSI